MVKNHMFADPNKVHHHKEPVFFRKWAEDREAEEKKLGTRYITQSKVKKCFSFHLTFQEYSSALWERIQSFVPTTMTTEDSKNKITWTAVGLHERVRFVRYGEYLPCFFC